MRPPKISREDIIKQAFRLFREKGYHKTSIADIATACGIFKSNVYHYFNNKEALMVDVLNSAKERNKKQTLKELKDIRKKRKARLKNYLKSLESEIFHAEGGSLFGNIGLEINTTDGDIRKAVNEYYEDWVKALTRFYREKESNKTASRLARSTVAAIEGAVMLSSVTGDKAYFTEVKEDIMSNVRKKVV